MNQLNSALPIDRLLTEAEIANHYGLSKSFLQASRLKGHGPSFIKLNHGVRYRVGDILNWIESRRFKNTAQYDQ